MGRHEKKSYLDKVISRYKEADKAKKALILDEFCAIHGYNRKYAIRLLNKKPKRRKAKIKPRAGRPRYDKVIVLSVLKAIWLATDQMCSKKLKAAIVEWLPHYESEQGLLNDSVRGQLYSLSPATIDRWLKPYRPDYKRKHLCGTKPGTLLKHQIPIKTHHWDVTVPGYLEADTVAHCGSSLAGEFVWSLTLTDINSTWTENRAIWNKGSEGVLNQIEDIERHLPFTILGFDCDNGSEFLNHHLVRYFTDPKKAVQFTRSRPYHKDDNAHVEQKNWTHVRQLFGYARFEDVRLVVLMNNLYKNECSDYQNHFCPSMKLKEKRKVGSRYSKKYDEPKTPYQRLIESDFSTQAVKDSLQEKHKHLNPFALKRRIEQKLKNIFKLVSVTS